MTAASAPNWDEPIIKASEQRGDPLADDAVAALIASQGSKAAFDLFAALISEDEVPVDQPIIATYLGQAAQLPSWASESTIEKAGEFFADEGWAILSLLGCAILPEGYVVPEVGRVLATTLALEEHVSRRLWETTQFVMDVMAPGGLDTARPGRLAGPKVRLLHALVRHMMETDSTAVADGDLASETQLDGVMQRVPWNPDWGRPVNQRMIAGTALAFSFIPLRGLRRLGYSLPADFENAYLHRWNVVAHMMGLERDLMATTYDDAAKLFSAIRDPLIQESADARNLAEALIAFMEGMIPSILFPLKGTPRMMMVNVCDARTMQVLGIELNFLERVTLKPMLHMMQWWGRIQGKPGSNGVLPTANRWIFRHLMAAFLKHERGGNRREFMIPDGLRDRWPV